MPIPLLPQHGVGIVAPYDFALDREVWRWVPDDVSLYVTRTPRLAVPVTVEMAQLVSETSIVQSGTAEVLTAEPEVVAYLCTSGSFVGGMEGERELREAMSTTGAPAALTTSGALLEALEHLGIKRIAVATPYVESVTVRLHDFLGEAGVSVTSSAHLGLLDHIWQVGYDEVTQLGVDADHPDAQALFLSCTNLPTYDAIPPLEEALGKPVLSANQVTMWAALRACGITPPPNGQRLFA
ncbi:MAG: Asp/Glu racemase [Streptosporangiales bacterium]|nr:Asp/Glu racemase [Streptosporangiales bacterium]